MSGERPPKVTVGFFSFTEITDAAEHRAYNEWHQLDHMPEQYPLPGIVYGQRWVSTPGCRAARAVDGELLAPVHYVTLYLMSEPIVATLDEFRLLGAELRRVGRFHHHRRALLSGPFAVETAAAAPRVLVSGAAVPYRPNRGAYVVVERRPSPARAGRGDATATDDADDSPRPVGELLSVPGVAGVWSFASDDERPGWRPGHHRVTVCFLDRAPLEVAPALAPTVGHGPRAASVVHAGPVETIVPWQWDWFEAGSVPAPA
ncbi:MAG: hypothetical protein ACRDY1_05330 [Acidimicrobiales bacterium]